MSILNCEIIAYGNTRHAQQIFTGYFLLKRQGIINLTSKIENIKFNNLSKPQHIRDAKKYHTKVIINNEINVYYDMHDSYEIDLEELYNVDIYFKRSYLDNYIDKLGYDKSKKIYKLGLYYPVFPNNIDFQNIKRSIFLSTGKAKLSSFMRAINLPASLTNAPKLKNLQEFPLKKYKTNKKILFMTQAWDPYDQKDRSSDKISERREINESRASYIRALKKEFGKDFYGGFSKTRYTLENYKDCIVPDDHLTSKSKYLELLKNFSICVATTGLHNSIGAKFGEYFAMSKAIVSEKLIYSLPGNLKAGKHYLEFKTPLECVEQVTILHQDDNKKYEMMIDNAKYYYMYLKPDILVYQSILKALAIK